MNKTILYVGTTVAFVFAFGAISFILLSSSLANAATLTAGVTVDTTVNEYNPYSDEAIGITAGVGVTPNALVIADNEGGVIITVTHVLLEQPGFVALYVMTDDGEAHLVGHSNLLGAAAYDEMEILLNEPVYDGQTISAVLYADTGNGMFDYPSGDNYARNMNQVVTDVDVLGVEKINELPILLEQAKAYVEAHTNVNYSD